MDIIDFLTNRSRQTYTGGKYYDELPSTDVYSADKAPKIFDYEYIDPTERRYASILENVITTDAADTTIMTRAHITFIPDAYIALRDGFLYQIESVIDDTRETQSQAARFSIFPPGVSHIIRLKKISDAWGIAGGR